MENQQSAHTHAPLTSEPQPLAPQSDPWQELEEMHRRMEALLHRTFGFDPKGFHRSGLREASETSGVRGIEPDIDIFENEREFLLYVALPGINPHEIDLQATEATLMLTAEIQAPFAGLLERDANTTQHRRSRRSNHNRFHFAYRLPTDIRPEEIHASYRHGLLELHLPKRQINIGKPLSVQIEIDGYVQGQAIASDLSSSYQMQPPPRMHEGAPTHKMGGTYVPTSSEDHTSKAQAVGARTESAHSGHESRNVPVDPGNTEARKELDIASQPHLFPDATGRTGKL